MHNNDPNNDPGDHHMGFALPHHRHHTNPVFKQSGFDISGGNRNFGAFPVPDSTTVTVHPGSPPFTVPDSTPLTVNNESAWLDAKLDQLKPEEHGEYLEPNAEKIYREKVIVIYLNVLKRRKIVLIGVQETESKQNFIASHLGFFF